MVIVPPIAFDLLFSVLISFKLNVLVVIKKSDFDV